MQHTSVGLYIGRFQPFHNGHQSIVNRMLGENEKNIILIGVVEKKQNCEISEENTMNPFSYEIRAEFFSHIYSREISKKQLLLYPLFDNTSDTIWIKSIVDMPLVRESTSIKVYCGDEKYDSAIQVLKRHISFFKGKDVRFIEISRAVLPLSGTEIREDIKNNRQDILQRKVPNYVFQKIIKK